MLLDGVLNSDPKYWNILHMSNTSLHVDENEGSFQLNYTERDHKLKCLRPGSAATNKMDRLSNGQTTCNSVEKGNDGGLNFDNSISDAVRTKLRQMRDVIEKEDPSSKVTDDDTLRRFLYARELNVEKASAMFAKYRKWRQTFVPLGYIPETMIRDELMKNSVHMQGFDKRGRPIAVIFLARHIPCRKTIENLKCHFVYIFDKMSASSRGQTKFTIIADFDGWTYKNVDIRGAIAVLEILQDYYPERLGKVYLIHRPYIFWAAWKIVSPFIDQVTREKIVFVEDKHLNETLLNDIDESQLPEIYGGKLPLVKIQDCVVPNWPPITST